MRDVVQGPGAPTIRRLMYVGVLYLGVVVVATSVLPTIATCWTRNLDSRDHGILAVLLAMFMPLFPFTALIILAKRGLLPSLFSALHKPHTVPIAVVGPAAVVLSLLVAIVGIWPWIWTLPYSYTPSFAYALLLGHDYIAIALWIVIAGFITPFVEEVVFRHGFTKWLQNKFDSRHKAASISATVFGAAHLGNLAFIPVAILRSAFAAGLFGLAMAYRHCSARVFSNRNRVSHGAKPG